jgi:alkylation response protein AidB-like acyl-CoA dehydrogenase
MSQYHAPLAEMQFVLTELAGLEQVAALPGYGEATPDMTAAILQEAAKFATNVLDPLNAGGDREGSRRQDDGSVKTPAGFKEAYLQFCANGWNGLTKSTAYGGQGLPHLVGQSRRCGIRRTSRSTLRDADAGGRSKRSSFAARRSSRIVISRRW